MKKTKEEPKPMPLFTKIQLFGFISFFIYVIIYNIYHNVVEKSAWEGKTKITRALFHEWSSNDGQTFISYTYNVKGKEYSKGTGNYNYPKLSAYDEWCDYVVEYPIKYAK